MTMVYKVLIIMSMDSEVIFRQIPHGKRKWGNCEFYINEDIKNPDFVFVFDELVKEITLTTNRNNTCLVTGEPPSVRMYSKVFTKQFGWLLSCQKNIYTRKNGIKSQPLLPWLAGIKQIGKNIGKYKSNEMLNYDFFSSQNKIETNRLNRIVVITSNKRISKGHCQRLDFIHELERLFPGKIDKFGNGFASVEDKYDVYKKYKYVLVIENCEYPSYWTEKLSDAFLANCYPLYIGDPEILNYFPHNSLTRLNINDVKESADIINKILNNDFYTKYFGELLKGKDLILNEYNLFNRIRYFVNSHIDTSESSFEITLRPNQTDMFYILLKLFFNIFHFEI